MEVEFRFVLLDFGSPMNNNVIKDIINSLEDILALGLSFSRFPKELYFGISVLNSDFTVLYSESYIRKNYGLFTKSLKSLLKTSKINSKVTVQKYKQLLYLSIKKIIYVSQKKSQTELISGDSRFIKTKVALITKKTASIVVDLLANIINKYEENLSNENSKQTYKVVQIINNYEERTYGVSDTNPFIKWVTCTDNIYDINYFLKDWFLTRKQKLQIQFSNDFNFKLQCEVKEFIINPISRTFHGKYDFFDETRLKNTNNTFPGAVHNLEIINRIPVNNLCPTLVFGVPRNISASRNDSKWIESQMNFTLFQQLCLEMTKSGEGFLAKSVLKTTTIEVSTFHFLTSDGCGLLMHDVTTEELHLPKRMKSLEPMRSDENAASIIENCIQKIQLINNYSPINFSSGLYKCLRHNLMETGQSKSFFGSFNPDIKLFGKKCGKKRSQTSKNDINEENINEPRKKSKSLEGKDYEKIHPALLPPEIVTKCRKIPSNVFHLPELSEDFTENLK